MCISVTQSGIHNGNESYSWSEYLYWRVGLTLSLNTRIKPSLRWARILTTRGNEYTLESPNEEKGKVFLRRSACWYTDLTCSIFSLKNKAALERANITHILSVLRLQPQEETFAGFQHHRIDVDDVEDENLLEHFPSAIKFIQSGLDAGGGVLVHWLVYPSSFLLMPINPHCPHMLGWPGLAGKTLCLWAQAFSLFWPSIPLYSRNEVLIDVTCHYHGHGSNF